MWGILQFQGLPATACCLNVALPGWSCATFCSTGLRSAKWNSQFLLSGWSRSSCLNTLKRKRSYSMTLCHYLILSLCIFENRRHRLDVVGSWCSFPIWKCQPLNRWHLSRWPRPDWCVFFWKWSHAKMATLRYRMRPGKSKPIRHYMQ